MNNFILILSFYVYMDVQMCSCGGMYVDLWVCFCTYESQCTYISVYTHIEIRG